MSFDPKAFVTGKCRVRFGQSVDRSHVWAFDQSIGFRKIAAVEQTRLDQNRGIEKHALHCLSRCVRILPTADALSQSSGNIPAKTSR